MTTDTTTAMAITPKTTNSCMLLNIPKMIPSARRNLFEVSLPPRRPQNENRGVPPRDPVPAAASTDSQMTWSEFKTTYGRAARNTRKGDEQLVLKKNIENNFTCPYGGTIHYHFPIRNIFLTCFTPNFPNIFLPLGNRIFSKVEIELFLIRIIHID